MKVVELQSFYIMNKFKKHKQLKNKILKAIEKMPNKKAENRTEDISKTDWDVPKDVKREYLEIFYNNIKENMNDIAKFLHCKQWTINNAWFNQYKTNDKVDWHSHPGSNFANIYFLEMPEKNMKTQFYNLKNKKPTDIDVEEGDILTFPAYYPHRSNFLKSDNQKTVIAFNTSFDYYNSAEINNNYDKYN